jgi:hypothetical protein
VLAIGVAVIVLTVLLLVGAVTGRVKATSCCGIADPRRDARMRDAFADEAPRQSDAPSIATMSERIGVAPDPASRRIS